MVAHQTIHAPQQDAAVQLPNCRAHCSVHAMQNPVVKNESNQEWNTPVGDDEEDTVEDI